MARVIDWNTENHCSNGRKNGKCLLEKVRENYLPKFLQKHLPVTALKYSDLGVEYCIKYRDYNGINRKRLIIYVLNNYRDIAMIFL